MEEQHERERIEEPGTVERAAQEPSSVDAMGLDKHRQVMGKVYGATRAQIFTRFAIFFAVVGLLAVGVAIAANQLDEAPDTIEVEAPWADPDAPQRTPKSIQ